MSFRNTMVLKRSQAPSQLTQNMNKIPKLNGISSLATPGLGRWHENWTFGKGLLFLFLHHTWHGHATFLPIRMWMLHQAFQESSAGQKCCDDSVNSGEKESSHLGDAILYLISFFDVSAKDTRDQRSQKTRSIVHPKGWQVLILLNLCTNDEIVLPVLFAPWRHFRCPFMVHFLPWRHFRCPFSTVSSSGSQKTKKN